MEEIRRTHNSYDQQFEPIFYHAIGNIGLVSKFAWYHELIYRTMNIIPYMHFSLTNRFNVLPFLHKTCINNSRTSTFHDPFINICLDMMDIGRNCSDFIHRHVHVSILWQTR